MAAEQQDPFSAELSDPTTLRPKPPALHVGGRDEPARVVRAGRGPHGVGRSVLDEPAAFKDRNALAQVAHHREIVGDKEQGELALGDDPRQ